MQDTPEVITHDFTVQNRMGIHTRPAAQIVRLANRYPDVEITVSPEVESIFITHCKHGISLRDSCEECGKL